MNDQLQQASINSDYIPVNDTHADTTERHNDSSSPDPSKERSDSNVHQEVVEASPEKKSVQEHQPQSEESPEKKSSPEQSTNEKKLKIDVLLKAAGDAPIMKKKKWAVDADKTIAYLIAFIRKYIKCELSESLFIYVNQTFVPSPDQLLSNLFECFGTDGKLVLHYCKSQAWG